MKFARRRFLDRRTGTSGETRSFLDKINKIDKIGGRGKAVTGGG
jgi:hypothetical protein